MKISLAFIITACTAFSPSAPPRSGRGWLNRADTRGKASEGNVDDDDDPSFLVALGDLELNRDDQDRVAARLAKHSPTKDRLPSFATAIAALGYLEERLSLSQLQLRKLVVAHPQLMFSSVPALEARLDRIETRLGGLREGELASIVVGQPPVLSANVTSVESSLAWIQGRLDLSSSDVRTMVQRHPSLLGYELETRVKPVVEFYASSMADLDDGDRRVSRFLVKLPALLEYNVRKRLQPRRERLMQARGLEASGAEAPPGGLDEESMKAIATFPDSKFEAWLGSGDRHGGGSSADAARMHDPHDEREEREGGVERSGFYVVVSNLQSGGNIGRIVRSAAIFGCQECIVIGQRRWRLSGDHGTRFDLPQRHLWSHADALAWLRSKGVTIYGVEIAEGAEPLMRLDRETQHVTFAFDGHASNRASGTGAAAFVFGNEGEGLSAQQREICDAFVYIPQARGGGGSASLNVACAAAVVLQAYCMYAGYPVAERDTKAEKFVAVAGDRGYRK